MLWFAWRVRQLRNMKEYDVVELICDLSDLLPAGTRGTIVMVYPEQNTAFEVEFTDANGKTIEVRSGVRDDQLKVVWTEK
jgi:hypothetical protein